MTDPHRELRDNLSNIDPAWQGEIKTLLDDRDHLLRVLQVEKGVASAAPEYPQAGFGNSSQSPTGT